MFYEFLTGESSVASFPPPSKKVEIDLRLRADILGGELSRTDSMVKSQDDPLADLGGRKGPHSGKTRMSGTVLTADLSSIALSDILMLIHNARKTGALCCTRGDVSKTLEWEGGQIVFARSSMREDRLASYLLTHGTITGEQLRTAEAASRDERLGETMLRLGMLTEAMLEEAVKGHVSEIVYSLFLWKDGALEFSEGDPPVEKIMLDSSVLNLILEATRLLDEWAVVREKIQDDQIVLTPLKTVEEVSAAANLSDVELDVLVLVDGRRTVRRVVDTAGHGEFEGWQALHALLSAGLLRVQMIAFDAGQAAAEHEVREEEEAIEAEVVRYGRALMKIVERLHATDDKSAEQRLRRRLREAVFNGAHLIRELAIEPDGRINKRILLANLAEDEPGTRLQQVRRSLDSLMQFLREELAGKVELDDVLAEFGSGSSTSG